MRAPGRPPASFGRTEPEGDKAEDFTVRGGEAFHLVLHVNAIPDEESLGKLREVIRETTRLAVVEGYAAAIADMDAASDTPDADGGGPPPGP